MKTIASRLNINKMRENIDSLHHKITAEYPKPYSFNPELPLIPQQAKIRNKYTELLCMPENRLIGKPVIIYKKDDNPEYDEIKFEVETEPDFLFRPTCCFLKNVFPEKNFQPLSVCRVIQPVCTISLGIKNILTIIAAATGILPCRLSAAVI